MLGETGGLSLSPGWDRVHLGDASPMKSKGHVCSLGKGVAVRLSAGMVEPPQFDSRAEHLAYWSLFQMQEAGLGGNQSHGADVVIGWGDTHCITDII